MAPSSLDLKINRSLYMTQIDKYHVVKITTSGLGDAIKAVLAGALYSEAAGRKLVVDWRESRYSVADENTFYSLFDLANIQSSKSVPGEQVSIAPKRWCGRLNMSMHNIYTEDGWEHWDRASAISAYSVDFEKLDYDEKVTVSWDFNQVAKLLPHFPNQDSVSELFRYAAQKFIVIDGDVTSRVAKVLEQLPKDYLAVHIRATKEFENNKGSLDIERFFNLISKSIGRSDAFFLASDNIEVQQELQRQYPNMLVLDKWFAEVGEALHMAESCPDKLENAKSALIDILLLANGKTLICNPNSCFSECAKYFSPHSDQILVSALQAGSGSSILSSIRRKLKLLARS